MCYSPIIILGYISSIGKVNIRGQIEFKLLCAVNATTPLFTLTCNSTGGPATIVTWTRNSFPVPDNSDYRLSQILVDRRAGSYSNTLTVTGMKPGNYQCTVNNARGSATSPIFKEIGKLINILILYTYK